MVPLETIQSSSRPPFSTSMIVEGRANGRLNVNYSDYIYIFSMLKKRDSPPHFPPCFVNVEQKLGDLLEGKKVFSKVLLKGKRYVSDVLRYWYVVRVYLGLSLLLAILTTSITIIIAFAGDTFYLEL